MRKPIHYLFDLLVLSCLKNGGANSSRRAELGSGRPVGRVAPPGERPPAGTLRFKSSGPAPRPGIMSVRPMTTMVARADPPGRPQSLEIQIQLGDHDAAGSTRSRRELPFKRKLDHLESLLRPMILH